MPMLPGFTHFSGIHWATGYLTNAQGYMDARAPHTGAAPTEALIMGISGGICAGYFVFEYEGWDPHMHFLTRYLFTAEPVSAFARLGIAMDMRTASDGLKGMAHVVDALSRGLPAVVWADETRLAYNAHDPSDELYNVMPMLMIGCDMTSGEVITADRARLPLTTTVSEMIAARGKLKKLRHQTVTLGQPDYTKLENAVRAGITDCLDLYTGKSPVGSASSFGISAFDKWAKLLVNTRDKRGWPALFAPGRRLFNGLVTGYQYIEAYFTGGHGARAMYADFLDEASVILQNDDLKDAATAFRACVPAWAALTHALLPDDVPLLAETRRLLQARHDDFLALGSASTASRREMSARLELLRAQAAADFPVPAAQVPDFYAGLRDRVLALRDREQAAVSTLAEAVGYQP
jgi:hypothetical protein